MSNQKSSVNDSKIKSSTCCQRRCQVNVVKELKEVREDKGVKKNQRNKTNKFF